MKSLAELKANMTANKEALRRKMEETNSGAGRAKDTRFWNLERDKSGTGSAVIRFLPARSDEDSPYIPTFDYGFQGPTGKWYVEESLQTIGKADPVAEANGILWQTGDENNIALARKRARRTHYISNILVITDPAHPENEGKVFLWKYGKKVMAKIKDMIEPPFKDDPSIDVFCFYGGANFRLKVKNVEGYPNYDSSVFDSAQPLMGGDDKKLQIIWDSEYSLKEFLDPNRFRSYEELKKRFEEVMGTSGNAPAAQSSPSPKAEKAAAAGKTRTVLPQNDDDDPPFDVDPKGKNKKGGGGGAATSRQQEEEDAFAALVEKD